MLRTNPFCVIAKLYGKVVVNRLKEISGVIVGEKY